MASRILSSWSRIAVRSSGPARSAARPATSTSRILRISRSSHNVLGCTRRSRPRVSRTARELPPLTTAPRPCSMLMRPRASSRFRASLTTVLLTPRCAHSSRSGGRRSPGSSPSDITISSNWSAARSLSLVRRDCSITLEHCHTNRDVCQTASIFGPPCSLRPLAVGSRCGPWALILPPARFHNAAVDRLHREDQEVDVPRQGHQCLTAEDGDGYRGQPDRHVEQVALDLLARHRKLVCAESQRIAQRVRPQVHQHEHELNSDESSAVYEQQERNLGRLYHFVLGKAEQLVHPQGKDELQWVDVEEHQEEQHRAQPQAREVPQAVAPEELVCSYHTKRSRAKQIAKAKKPRMSTRSSSKVFGTSKDTTRSVTPKAKTASVKASIREISSPRQRKSSSPPCLRANPSRTTRSPPLSLRQSVECMIRERPLGAQDRTLMGDELIAHDRERAWRCRRRSSCEG